MEQYLMKQKCKNCNTEFERRYETNFCKIECFYDYRRNNPEEYKKGRFEKGHTPWNKDTKGVMKANKTTFKKGHRPATSKPVGTISLVSHKREKYPRRHIKIKEPNTWMPLARYIWEKKNGKIPKGYVLHHKDRNPLNDTIDNLEILTRAEHLEVHRKEHNKKRQRRRIKESWAYRKVRKKYGLPEKRYVKRDTQSLNIEEDIKPILL